MTNEPLRNKLIKEARAEQASHWGDTVGILQEELLLMSCELERANKHLEKSDVEIWHKYIPRSKVDAERFIRGYDLYNLHQIPIPYPKLRELVKGMSEACNNLGFSAPSSWKTIIDGTSLVTERIDRIVDASIEEEDF